MKLPVGHILSFASGCYIGKDRVELNYRYFHGIHPVVISKELRSGRGFSQNFADVN